MAHRNAWLIELLFSWKWKHEFPIISSDLVIDIMRWGHVLPC